ncbi:hypothetical protein [Duganella violaceipulchra]|uniref:AbiTii domain-containing protein n=1 Tax=Duganella violaceipulchra TaxID=2849652 RepID=A0AA41LBP5_9BURK|nr:hypothetical protein [Duganella violaceicalia]MBV6325510.1 hypothetical protein [Duganella violaceicalia]MCP2012682.1 hypothetical protein [Duganella violaceicalia]
MAQPIILQLQELASSSKHDIADLLRKALIVATKLRLDDFKVWIGAELNGYKDANSIPDYRIIYGDVRVQNPYRGLIPLEMPPELRKTLSVVRVFESVSKIQELASVDGGEAICYYLPPKQENAVMQAQGDYPMRPVRIVSASTLLATLQAVRTRILEWALQLEEQGVLGHGLSFSEQERSAAMSNNIRIENFQGVLGNVSGGTVSQTNSLTVQSSNFESLAKYLEQQGVKTDEVKQLEVAIASDSRPESSSKLGPKVSAWVGKMMVRAASGGWDIGVAAAGGLLTSAIAKFYGLP